MILDTLAVACLFINLFAVVLLVCKLHKRFNDVVDLLLKSHDLLFQLSDNILNMTKAFKQTEEYQRLRKQHEMEFQAVCAKVQEQERDREGREVRFQTGTPIQEPLRNP